MDAQVSARAVATIVEQCPECSSPDVQVVELGWFAVQLDRRDELADAPAAAEDDGVVEFSCRDCAAHWR